MFNRYIRKITKLENTDDILPNNGFYATSISKIGGKKFLIKTTNSTGYHNNEVYLTSIMELLLWPNNSVHDIMIYESANKLDKITQQDEAKIQIASQVIEDTEDLMNKIRNNQLNLEKKPQNLVSSLLVSIITGNMDTHGGNILVDNNNKFYIIDPLIRSKNNKFNNSSTFSDDLEEKYTEFIGSLNLNNVKKQTIELFEWYLERQSESMETISNYFLQNNDGNEKFISEVTSISQITQKIQDEKIIRKLISLMTDDEILEEIKAVKDNFIKNKNEIMKLGEFFESTETFENFGKKGIPEGHINVVLDRLESLNNSALFK